MNTSLKYNYERLRFTQGRNNVPVSTLKFSVALLLKEFLYIPFKEQQEMETNKQNQCNKNVSNLSISFRWGELLVLPLHNFHRTCTQSYSPFKSGLLKRTLQAFSPSHLPLPRGQRGHFSDWLALNMHWAMFLQWVGHSIKRKWRWMSFWFSLE